jgi:peptidoglycan pentaglycine glycine transferase (the first glycine)
MLRTTTITDRDTWNDHLRDLPYAHVLQSWEWGAFKQQTTGWQPTRILYQSDEATVAAASLLTRTVGPFAVIYVPRGPVLDYGDTTLVDFVLDDIQRFARRRRALWLKIDPALPLATGVPGDEDDTPHADGRRVVQTLEGRGWQLSDDQVQFRNTITLDLTADEDDLLMAMSGNTRRKVRTAYKKDVTIRSASIDDLDTLYDLYHVTGRRDDFLIRPADYYKKEWRDFMQAGLAHALIAQYDGQPIAHVILFRFGRGCWYFYGASSNQERNRMPNYALQWEAMRWAKAQGCTFYDMWGAPDEFHEDDSMWGVYEFKRGFRGTVVRHIGAWDYAPFPPLYGLYTRLWPRVLNWLRRRRT